MAERRARLADDAQAVAALNEAPGLPPLAGLRLGQPDGADLGVSDGHPRDRVIFGSGSGTGCPTGARRGEGACP